MPEAMRVQILGKAGDTCCWIVQRWGDVARYRNQLNASDEDVTAALEQLEMDARREGHEFKSSWEPGSLESMEDALRAGISAFEQALQMCAASGEQAGSLERRMGHAHNELGVLLMSQASSKSMR